MMKIRLFAMGVLLACWAAGVHADQAVWITKDQAEAAKDALSYNAPLRIYCQPCGDEHWHLLVVGMMRVMPSGEDGYHELVIGEEAIDLAYTYFPHEGEYRNLAMHLGIEVQDVPEILDPWLTGPLPDFSEMFYSGEMEDGTPITAMLRKKDDFLVSEILFGSNGNRLHFIGDVDEYGTFSMRASLESEVSHAMEGVIAPEAMAVRGSILALKDNLAQSFEWTQRGRFASQGSRVSVGDDIATAGFTTPIFSNDQGRFLHEVNLHIERELQSEASLFLRTYARKITDVPLEPGYMYSGPPHHSWGAGGLVFPTLSDSFVSACYRVSEYTGGAHQLTCYTVFNLVDDNDAPRVLALSELFVDESDYWEILTDACIASLRKQEASRVLDGSVTDIGEEVDAAWSLSFGGLSFYFGPNEVGRHGEGPHQVWIPFEDLADILKPGMPDALFDEE